MSAKPRRDPTRAELARRGLIAILAVGLVIAAFAVRSSGVIGGPDVASARVSTAGGSLAGGADVKLRGVIVGKVREVTADPAGGVRISVAFRDGRLSHVPANVTARVLPATIFGTSYLDLVTPGRSAAQPLHAGAVIPADRSTGTLELQQALDDIDTLVSTLRPAQLSATLGAVANALDGRGEQIGQTIDTLDRLLRKVQTRLPLLQTDLRKLADNLELLTRLTPTALAALSDSLTTMRTLVDKQDQLHRVIVDGTRLAGDGNTFLGRNKGVLVEFLRSAGIVADVYHDNAHDAFTRSFATIRRLADKVGGVMKHGWVDNEVIIQQGVPDYYGPADCPRFGPARGDNCGGGR